MLPLLLLILPPLVLPLRCFANFSLTSGKPCSRAKLARTVCRVCRICANGVTIRSSATVTLLLLALLLLLGLLVLLTLWSMEDSLDKEDVLDKSIDVGGAKGGGVKRPTPPRLLEPGRMVSESCRYKNDSRLWVDAEVSVERRSIRPLAILVAENACGSDPRRCCCCVCCVCWV